MRRRKPSLEVTACLKEACRILRSHRIPEPGITAELLLAHVLKCSRIDLFLKAGNLNGPARKRYWALLKKRLEYRPLQYLTRTVSFFNQRLRIEPGVFIPRPETEILVAATLDLVRQNKPSGVTRILDIGTGCGNIAVALAKNLSACRIIATDISTGALKVARENARQLKVNRKIRFCRADLFPEQKGKFDLIVSNPPYIPFQALKRLPPEVQKEPRCSLNGGASGLAVISRILGQAAKYLTTGGYLLVEVGAGQGGILKRKEFPGLKLLGIKPDLAGIPRVAIFRRYGKMYGYG